MKRLFFVLATIICFSFSANAQEKQLPTNKFTTKKIENFKDNFKWDLIGCAVNDYGYLQMEGKANAFSFSVPAIAATAKSLFDHNKNFKITVNLEIKKFKALFWIRFNSGNLVFSVAEKQFTILEMKPMRRLCLKKEKTSLNLKGDVSLSVQKEGSTLFFFYNDTLVCDANVEVESSDIILHLMLLNGSTEVNVKEVIIEQ